MTTVFRPTGSPVPQVAKWGKVAVARGRPALLSWHGAEVLVGGFDAGPAEGATPNSTVVPLG